MKYAVTIAETKSINKAAEKLYVGQSALSRAVKELETSLGAAVFERSAEGDDSHSERRGIHPTCAKHTRAGGQHGKYVPRRREGAETLFRLCAAR